MPSAQNIQELSEIREHNRLVLDAIDNVNSTALGKKNGNGAPAVLVFVQRKIAEPWLAPSRVIPPMLTGPRGLECPTDVISSETDRDFWLRTFADFEGTIERGLERFPSLVDTDPLEGANLQLRDQLRGAGGTLTPGSLLSYTTRQGNFFGGTLASFARRRTGQALGFLTNQHVGEFDGNILWHPEVGNHPVGIVRQGVLEETITHLYGAGLPTGSLETILTVDAAFSELDPRVDPSLLDPRLPGVRGNRIERKQLGTPVRLDVTTMGPVGEKVLGVGTNRGEQKGRVAAVGFDFRDGDVRRVFDYLIVGDNGTEFSDPGDSGKLVVTASRRKPLAIMWGGEWARRRPGRGLENFTNATEIGRILDTLDVDIVRRF